MPDSFSEDTVQQNPTSQDSSSAVSSNEPVPSSGVNEGTASQDAPASSFQQPAAQQPTGQPAQGQAPETAWTSIRDAAYNQYGLDLRNLPDDGAALRHLVAQANQAQQSQQYAQRYLQNATQFEAFLTQQQQQQKPADKPGWWAPPEYNPAWKGLVSKDPDTGEFKLAPGAPQEILPKVLAYEQYRRDFADRLTSDPVATLKPLIEEIAAKIGEGQIQQHLGSYQDKVYADNYVQQNSGWLHQRDAQGNTVVDPFSRQPLLSPAGQRFKGYVEQLQSSGITNLKQQEQLARGFVERDLAMAQLAQYQQGAQNGQMKNQFLQQNNTRQPNQSGSMTPGAPTNQRLSLKDRLAQTFRAGGITDADFQNQPQGAAA